MDKWSRGLRDNVLCCAVLSRDKPSVFPYDTVERHGKSGYVCGASKFAYAMKVSKVASRNVQDNTLFPAMSANWVFRAGTFKFKIRNSKFLSPKMRSAWSSHLCCTIGVPN